jgi:hypothetical protein
MTGLMSKDEDEVNSETMKPGNLIIELSICFRTVLHAFAQFSELLLCVVSHVFLCFRAVLIAFVQFCVLLRSFACFHIVSSAHKKFRVLLYILSI